MGIIVKFSSNFFLQFLTSRCICRLWSLHTTGHRESTMSSSGEDRLCSSPAHTTSPGRASPLNSPVTSPRERILTPSSKKSSRHEASSSGVDKSKLAFSIASIMGSGEKRAASPEAPRAAHQQQKKGEGPREGGRVSPVSSPARGRTAESPVLSAAERGDITAASITAAHPVIPIPTHAAAAQYYHSMNMLAAEAQRRNAMMAAGVGVSADTQAQKEMLEMSARYMPYLHPAFLMGRMSEYHTHQLLRNYPSYLQQRSQSQAQIAREYLMRADHQPGFEPGASKLGAAGYNPAKHLAQAYAQAAALQAQQNNHHLSASKKSPSTRDLSSHSSMDTDEDEINVTDTDTKSVPGKTLDLSLKNQKNLLKSEMRSPLGRSSEYVDRTPESKRLSIEQTHHAGHLTSAHNHLQHLAKFSSPER